MDNTMKMEIAKCVGEEIVKQFNPEDIMSLIIGQNGIINPSFKKEFWIGGFRISINVHC